MPGVQFYTVEWVHNIYAHSLLTYDKVIKRKARQLINFVNSILSSDDNENQKRWHYQFKQKNKFRRFHYLSEAANTNNTIVEQVISVLHENLLDYLRKDTWNADDTEQYYIMALSQTLGNHRVGSGQYTGDRKQVQDEVSIEKKRGII